MIQLSFLRYNELINCQRYLLKRDGNVNVYFSEPISTDYKWECSLNSDQFFCLDLLEFFTFLMKINYPV